MGLVVQVKAVGDQFLNFDFGRTFRTAVAARRSTISAAVATARSTTVATTGAAIAATSSTTWGTTAGAAATRSILTGRTIAAAFFRFFLFRFSHV
jgi:hypothetical protein